MTWQTVVDQVDLLPVQVSYSHQAGQLRSVCVEGGGQAGSSSLPCTCRTASCVRKRQSSPMMDQLAPAGPGNNRLDVPSSSSEQEESLCQEDIQKLLGLQQSHVSLDKWDLEWSSRQGDRRHES